MTMLLLAAALAQPDPLTFSGAGMDLTVRQGGFRSDPRRVIIERADPAHYDPELPEAGDTGGWKARRRADRTERQFLRPSETQLNKLIRARYLEPAEARQTGEYGVGGEEPFYKVEVNPSYPFPDLFHKKVRLRPRAIAPSPRVAQPAPRIASRRAPQIETFAPRFRPVELGVHTPYAPPRDPYEAAHEGSERRLPSAVGFGGSTLGKYFADGFEGSYGRSLTPDYPHIHPVRRAPAARRPRVALWLTVPRGHCLTAL